MMLAQGFEGMTNECHNCFVTKCFFQVLRSFLTSGPPPNKVVESKPDSFTQRGIHAREDGLVLYLPPVNVPKGSKANYEIVLHRPATETLHQIFRYLLNVF